MKQLILTFLIIAGFVINAGAQSLQVRTVRPRPVAERRIDRANIRRIRRMERRHHRRLHRRMAFNSTPSGIKNAVLLLQAETKIIAA